MPASTGECGRQSFLQKSSIRQICERVVQSQKAHFPLILEQFRFRSMAPKSVLPFSQGTLNG
jgi:hypothetical protein